MTNDYDGDSEAIINIEGWRLAEDIEGWRLAEEWEIKFLQELKEYQIKTTVPSVTRQRR